MKRLLSFNMIFVLMVLCGCSDGQENNKATRFLLDTVVTLTADCDDDTLYGAFEQCADYEKLLSRTVKDSDVYRLNNTSGFTTVSDDTLKIIRRSLYYSELSKGKFDITICPVSELWDFNNEVIPDRNEIAEALKNVDYESIEIDGQTVNLNGKKIDLGGIAKGYIADRLAGYFADNGVKSGNISLGGNLVIFGDELNVGIKKPFSDELSCSVSVKNKSVVTSGTYERYIEMDGVIYHHVLDPETGYGCDSGLTSATVIGDSSMDCDALSTVCLLLGAEKAKSIIESTSGTEAIFIDKDGNITYTSGLYREGEQFVLK